MATPTAVASLEEMGFPRDAAERALNAAKGNIEQAVVRLSAGDGDGVAPMDVDADTSTAAGPSSVLDASSPSSSSSAAAAAASPAAAAAAAAAPAPRRSWKCSETGRLFATMADVQMYSERTGRTAFEESSDEVKPRSKEELAAAQAALKEKLVKKRKEREEADKLRRQEAERKRRAGGQNAGAVREEMEAKARKRMYAEQRKEKQRVKAERERLRREIAKDKAERQARGGKLAGKLSAEGYAPAGQNLNAQASADAKQKAVEERRRILAAGGVKGFEVEMPREERLAKALTALGMLKARDAGKIALRTARKMLNNICKQPGDPKFRGINLQNEAIRKRITSKPGGMNLLMSAGFKRNEETQRLEMGDGDVDVAWIQSVIAQAGEVQATFG